MTTTGAERDSPGWLRLIARAALRHRRNVVIAFTAALFGSAAQVVVPLVAREIVDEVVVARRDPLWPWLLVLFAVAGASFALAYLRRYRGGQVAYSVQLDLRNAVHDHLQRLDQGTLATLPTGQLVSRANSDSTLVVGLLSFLPLITGNAIQMVLAVVVMFVLSPPLAAVSLVVIPALFAVSYRMRTRIFPASWDAQQKEGDVAQIVDEGVNGVRVVKAFGQEARELERLTGVARTLYGARVRAVRLTARFQPLLEAIPTLAQVAMLLLGGLLALEGTISLGTFLAFSTYVGQFVAPSRQLAGLLTVGQQARAGVERIFGLLALPPGVVGGDVDLDRAEGALEFRDVRFGYGDIPVLDGFSLRIEPGERVALVGASGSGKSTAAMLVARFRDPQGGAVLLDGRDLRSLTLDSLRRQIGVAFEESFLFSDTIGANIAFGRPDATPAEIEAAARVAQAHDFVSRLPRGYDTVVGERGLTLSGGQRQRVALARAVLADPRILVLDDATSAIDATTEAAIHDGLRDVLDGRTTLLIAHRASTLHLADRIVVMAEGRAVEQGTHDELTASSARYRALLSGLAEEPLREAGDSIEALAAVTSDAWQPLVSPTGAARSTTAAARTSLAAAGGNTTSAIGGLPATPDLLAKVEALPPVRDDIEVDPARDHARDRHFSLGGLLRQFRRAFVLGFGLVILDAVFGLAGPALVRAGVDRGVVDDSRGALFACAIAFLVVTAIDLAVRIGATFVTGRTAERIMFSLRVRIWSQLQRLSLDYYEREQAGRVMTRMTTDVDQFEQLVGNGLLGALVALVTFVGVGVALLLIDVELGLVVLSIMLPLGLATWWFRRRSIRVYTLSRDRIAVVNSAFQEDVSGIRETQAFGHEAASSRRFHDLGESYWRSRVAAQRLVSLYFPFVLFLSACADALVLGVGSALINSGAITVGTLIAFLLYIDMFFAPIQQLSQVFDAWQQTRVSVNRIAEVMALDTLTPEPEQPETWDERRGAVTVQRVGFVYPGAATDGEDTLHGVDLHVSAGETVALVGETGAGKSTVLKLLARFYDPVSGRVCVDEHDLRTLALGDFRRGLGYVPQESFLFTGPVRDNIAYGRPEASDAEVEAAARAVGAHEVIAALPDGYRTVLGERGGSLSSGQRQLIALARAQLADPVLLLLDEATSSLDLATEARVNRAMARVAHGRTTVVIAHRLPTARAADRIVVMADGTVVESGSHDELLAADGRYARMWRAFESVGAGA